MFINRLLKFIHKYTNYIYENSSILQNIDKVIFLSILSVFVASVFCNSDIIGYFAIITTLLTVVRIIFTPDDEFKCEKFELFLLIYFMLVLVSLAGSTLFHLSLKGFTKTLIYLSYYISVVHHLKYNKNHILPILYTIAGCLTYESIIGLGQSFAKVDEISGWQDMTNLNPEEVITRVYGTLLPLNPNLLGGYFILTIPSLLGLFSYHLLNRNYLLTFAFGGLNLLSWSVLFLTGCRGAYIALFSILVCAFLIALKIFWNKFKKRFISFCSVIAGMGIFALMAITPLRVRVFSIFAMREDSSNSFRFNVYKSAIQMFKDNWLVGIGQGNQNFREVYGLYMKTGFDALSAYNIYLETAVESGIFALIAFLGFLFILIKDAVTNILRMTDVKSIIFISIPLLSIIGSMVHGMVDTVFFRPQLQIVFWTMCAVLSNQIYPEIKQSV